MKEFSSSNWFTKQWEPESSYYSAMQGAKCPWFYYLIADPKVG